jgi:hypothetical protein
MLPLIRSGIVAALTVVPSSGPLKVMVIAAPSATLDAPLAGATLTTLGRTVRLPVPVLKLLLKAGATFPLTSVTPLTLTV